MIIVSGVLSFDPSVHDKALRLAGALADATLREPGCRAYGFWMDPEVRGRFRIFEEWDSQEALTDHFATPHFAAFGQGFEEGELNSMDVHRYIDPIVAELF